MRRWFIPASLLAVMLVAALAYFSGGGRAPSGQPPLERLTAQNVVEVRNEFNAAKDDVRVLMLLSPT